MKYPEHTEFMPTDENRQGITPSIGTKFVFHGMLVEAVSSSKIPCNSCVSYVLNDEKPMCSQLPPCSGVTFVKRHISRPKEYKVWRVIRRLDKANDET